MSKHARRECSKLFFFLISKKKVQAMKQTARNTQSATHLKKSERVEIVIRKEEDVKVNLDKRDDSATASLDTIVKAEEKDLDLKIEIVKAEEEKGLT